MIKKGQADIVFSTSIKDTRKPYVHYSADSTWKTEVVFFTRQDKYIDGFNSYQTIKDKGLRIAVVRENSYHPSFWEHFPTQANGVMHEQLMEVRDNDHALVLLKHGRVDLAVMDRTVGRTILASNTWGNSITWYQDVIYRKPYPIAFSKSSAYVGLADIRAQFDAELAAMKASGEYNEIMCRWQALPLKDCSDFAAAK